MYTMPVTLTPELEAKVKIAKSVQKDHYKPAWAADPLIQAILTGPDASNLEKNLK